MWVALGINAGMLVAEAVGGLATGSLAVLADAGHLLSDVGSIGLALFAAALAAPPAGGGGALWLSALGDSCCVGQRAAACRRRSCDCIRGDRPSGRPAADRGRWG